jgi:hypothetical protein
MISPCSWLRFALAAGSLAAAAALPAQTPAWQRALNPPVRIPFLSPEKLEESKRPAWAGQTLDASGHIQVETLEPSNHARVVRVVPGKTDVVVLDGGLYAGLQVGMALQVERFGTPVAKLVVVASEIQRSAALILADESVSAPLAGDDVSIVTYIPVQ